LKQGSDKDSFGLVTSVCRPVAFQEKADTARVGATSVAGKHAARRKGFTVLELLVVTFIIAVLVSLSFPVYGLIRRKAEAAACAANMKSLFSALQMHTTDKGYWPQPPASALGNEDDFWNFWITVLAEYDVTEETWMCPTYKRLSAEDDSSKRKATYLPTGFDAVSPLTPYRWGNQPWLVEIGDHHGDGPLMLRPDGAVIPFSMEIPDKS
jgi:prepilin-type N-terminal cleavage/methylation domain-containing protein